MANNFVLKDSLPVTPLKIAILESCKDPAVKVNDYIVQFGRNGIEELMRRKEDFHYHGYDVGSYLLHYSCPRFGTGEDRAVINESVRGTDVSVMVNVMNYSIPHTVGDYANHMSSDGHFQDLKRIIGAHSATAHRVNVVMPFPYGSCQYKHNKREFLDCAVALEELAALGMENIITFDVHDPRVQNATPPISFDDLMPMYQFVKALFSHDSSIRINKEYLMVVSPDEGAVNRAVCLANNLGVDMGMLYKRGDYSQVIGDCNSIVVYELLGSSIEGKTIFIANDMISSGESMLGTCKELKEHKVDKVIIYCTFSLSTNGLEKFDEYYYQEYLDYVITTNLNYRTQGLPNRERCLEVDMSRYLAVVIGSPNHDRSISAPLSPTEKIQKLAQKHQNGRYEYFQEFV